MSYADSVPRALAFATLFAASAAEAQTVCPANDPELYPFDGAMDVPRDPVVRVFYRDPAHAPGVTGGAAERVIEVFEDGRRLAGSATLENDATGAGREAIWIGESLFPASTRLEAQFQDEFGVPSPFFFTTGESLDGGPPEFSGASKVEIVAAEQATLDVDAFRIRVTFPPAEDDVGAGNVENVVYQTDGPGWDMPVERARVRCVNAAGSGIAAFEVPRGAVDRWACFEVRAVDFYGQSDDNDREVCGIPEGPGVFRSICSVAGPGGSPAGAWPLALLVLARVGYRSFARRRAST